MSSLLDLQQLSLSVSSSSSSSSLSPLINAATFQIFNNCPFIVWAAWASTGPRTGGGNQLSRGQSWTINVDAGTTGDRIWARTGCSFDSSGRGSFQTGDCGGMLQCQDFGQLHKPSPSSPSTSSTTWTSSASPSRTATTWEWTSAPPQAGAEGSVAPPTYIVGECPKQLKVPGGCNHPCTVFRTLQYAAVLRCSANL
ncbi:hypothetical protein ZIOFF_000111 [Zingiber officinale]|uniref:Thaumatin-like protein n=1 Tax=Zingiber officinale TaxID=94328 RepID=A0A8J5LR75_ZINOF|nr:hypothetical protein ZIOFF_000111 [Zingiber officinale]